MGWGMQAEQGAAALAGRSLQIRTAESVEVKISFRVSFLFTFPAVSYAPFAVQQRRL